MAAPREAKPDPALSRRTILARLLDLAWAIPLGLGAAQALRFLGFAPPTRGRVRFVLGAPPGPEALPAYFEEARVWLHRDSGGYYAVDAVCTHLGCIVRRGRPPEGFRCECHGSRFAPDGAVLAGPASQPLRLVGLHWAEGGQLVVDRAEEAAPATRLAPG